MRGLSASMNCYACSSTEIGEYCKEPLKNGVGRAEIQSMSQSCDQYCAVSTHYPRDINPCNAEIFSINQGFFSI